MPADDRVRSSLVIRLFYLGLRSDARKCHGYNSTLLQFTSLGISRAKTRQACQVVRVQTSSTNLKEVSMKNFRYPAAVALVLTAAVLVSGQRAPSPAQDDTLRVTVCHQPGTRTEKTLTLPPSSVEGHLAHGDVPGICPANRLSELLPFLQNSSLVQVDTGRLLEGVRAGEVVDLPCAAPGGAFVVIPSELTERDLRAPGSSLPFLNTYEVVMDDSMRAGVFSITAEDFRSWITDPHLGQCFAEPIGPLLRGNGVPESEVQSILAVANVVVYNIADVSASINLLNDVALPTPVIDPGPRISLPRLSPRKHDTGDGGNTPNFGVLFMGYIADINFQNAVGTAYNVSGAARDTKVRELMGWLNSRLYDTLHWYEPAASRGGHDLYNIIPVVGSIDLCGVAATNAQASNCPHTAQHVNFGVSMFGSPSAGSFSGNSSYGTLGCGDGHPGAVVNGQPLKTCNVTVNGSSDVNHGGISLGTGVADAVQNFAIGHEVGHVFGCEPDGAPGEGVAPQTDHHTATQVTFDGVAGPSFMIATGNFGVGNDPRPLYTPACDQAIKNIVNSNINPPTTGAH